MKNNNLLLLNYYLKTGKTYAEVMEEAEDQYVQMEIDRIRGK